MKELLVMAVVVAIGYGICFSIPAYRLVQQVQSDADRDEAAAIAMTERIKALR